MTPETKPRAPELLPLAQAFVDRKYVARSDARQKAMGLAYVEAERQDLAREIVRFVEGLPGSAQTPSRERIARIIGGSIFGAPDDLVGPATRSAREDALRKADAVIAALATPAAPSVEQTTQSSDGGVEGHAKTTIGLAESGDGGAMSSSILEGRGAAAAGVESGPSDASPPPSETASGAVACDCSTMCQDKGPQGGGRYTGPAAQPSALNNNSNAKPANHGTDESRLTRYVADPATVGADRLSMDARPVTGPAPEAGHPPYSGTLDPDTKEAIGNLRREIEKWNGWQVEFSVPPPEHFAKIKLSDAIAIERALTTASDKGEAVREATIKECADIATRTAKLWGDVAGSGANEAAEKILALSRVTSTDEVTK